eukprot:g9786.t1
MQTPKTYTAWQPDSGPSQPAGKAKEDLLAAERAFDEEDDADKGGGKKKSSRSFLQLHDKDLGDSMDDLGGRDPLAFFQLGDLTGIPPFAAPRAQSEVALLLGKFAEFTNSSTLFELSRSQLQKQEEPEEDRSLQFCNSLVLHQSNDLEADVTAELQKHYAETKARLEGQALRHEVSAREHLVSAFTNTSQRFTTLQQLLERSFEHEETRLHGLEQQLIQLESTKSAHTTAEEQPGRLSTTAVLEAVQVLHSEGVNLADLDEETLEGEILQHVQSQSGPWKRSTIREFVLDALKAWIQNATPETRGALMTWASQEQEPKPAGWISDALADAF